MLQRILESTRDRVALLRAEGRDWRAAAVAAPPVRDLASALRVGAPAILGEIKRRSPSAGPLAPEIDPAGAASAYVAGGSAAISVLTEPHFFSGSLDDLDAVRSSVSVPVLRKDFVVDTLQVWEARVHGADAVLLIVAALEDEELETLLAAASEAGMTAVVEVHSEPEAERALHAGAAVVGVNNRDLADFTTDLGVAERIAPLLDGVPVRVAESGVSTPQAAARMWAAGYHAILVGEALVRAEDPSRLVRQLRGAEASR